MKAGFTAVKMNASAELAPIDTPARTAEVVERVAAVREVLGDERDVAVDFHGRASTAMARRCCPCSNPCTRCSSRSRSLPEHSGRLRSLVESTSIPLATGERLYSRWDFREVMTSGIAVAQPDLSHAGGISEVRRIAAMAETYDVTLAPHCPLGPIALAASLQIAFAVPNFLIQEQSMGIHYDEGLSLTDCLVD